MTSSLAWPLSVPVLGDGVVTLRAHTPADLDAMTEMGQDPEMARWTTVPSPYRREDSEHYALTVIPERWNARTMRSWAIEATDETGRARFAGTVDVRESPIGFLGFGLHPWARGRGVMTRAVRLAVDWCFTHGRTEIVHWRAHVGNLASLRVAHRCGFSLDAVVPGLLLERDRVHDVWTGSLRFGDTPLPRTTWAESPVLTSSGSASPEPVSSGVRLRPLGEDDVPRIVEACTDPVTRRWLSSIPVPYTEAAARAYLDDCSWQAAIGAKAGWAVTTLDDDRLLGHISLMLSTGGISPQSGEIGYWMHPDSRGRGLAREATRLVIAHAFGRDGAALSRLDLYAAEGNDASNRVARSLGFRSVGTRRRAERLGDGSDADLHLYELLRDA